MESLTLPWSKSITNRDFVLAALTQWKTILRWILLSDDTHHMIHALKNIWIDVILNWNDAMIEWWIEKIKWDDKEIYVWQSGTCMRFLTALIILNHNWTITISGEERLIERPMWDLLDALKQMWVRFESSWNFPPIKVYPSKVKANKVKMNGTSSSQFFTALMMIAPVLKEGLEIEVIWDLVSKPYIDLTINEMSKFWVDVENQAYRKFIIKPWEYKPWELIVEGDASALSYIANFIVLHGWEIKINNIGLNSKQWDYKYLDTLKIFWLRYTSDGIYTILQASWIKNINLDTYKNHTIDFENMPDVSMSYMSLAVFLPWDTRITWLQTLNFKECKRIDAMKNELQKLWVEVSSDEKSITIWELKSFPNNKIDIETYNDHRIAMVFWILGSYIWKLDVLNPPCVEKTYPSFWEDLEKLVVSN